MITYSYFEKISFDQYYQDRLDMLDYSSNKNYLSENGIFDENIDRHQNDPGFKFKDYIEPGSILEAKIKQLFYKEWENIEIPKRGTKYSAGYDFVCPFTIDTKFSNNFPYKIPTGIRFVSELNEITGENLYSLNIYPRSSTAMKKGMNLTNSVAIIDLDYCLSENEGHIIISLAHVLTPDVFDWIHKFNDNRDSDTDTILFNRGERFVQGIISPVYLVRDEINNFDSLELRNGGIGSTGR